MSFLVSSIVGLCTIAMWMSSGQISCVPQAQQIPLVISTWPFVEAVSVAWKAIEGGASAVDAVVDGCSTCEELQCDGSGVSPVDYKFECLACYWICSVRLLDHKFATPTVGYGGSGKQLWMRWSWMG
eukprot:TRINITY_DN6207_c0_g1_i3.p1 TRINITY_DN6207_c0_g1~~TRINITY_DN6207_c0_g1_i3.p1  ORF type:complete len:137 (+),score=10.65 TRINITY_DN6207_c0_g1_i3:33-413(+)